MPATWRTRSPDALDPANAKATATKHNRTYSQHHEHDTVFGFFLSSSVIAAHCTTKQACTRGSLAPTGASDTFLHGIRHSALSTK
jgi:hypothetical protein